MDTTVIAGAAGALMVGITGSVHCLLMCGPLACATLPGLDGSTRVRAIAGYQGGRLLAYALVGGALGALGGGVALALSVSTRPYLPWVMAAALVASALELGKKLRPLPGIAHVSRCVGRVSARFSPPLRASALGAITPLLPCGLLYGVLAAALASGSFLDGALITFAFAAGALPALLAAQVQSGLWRSRKPIVSFVFQRAVPLAAAAVLVYRAVNTKLNCH